MIDAAYKDGLREVMNVNNKDKENMAFGCFGITIAAIIVSLGGWVTHVVSCIQSEDWLFLIAGAIAAPVGVIHGIGIWFGAW